MADTKVTNLSAISQANVLAAEFYANDAGTDKKVTGTQIVASVTPSKATVSEGNTIDCSEGSCIQMAITQDRTFSFSNLEGGGVRTVVITGDYAVDFNAAYSTHFQSTLSQRTGDVKIFTVMNYGTTGSPTYLIKDAIGGQEAITVPVTRYGEDASTGTKIRFPMPFAFYIQDLLMTCSVAPVGSTAIIDINKDTTTILTNKLSIDASETTSSTAATAHSFVSTALRTFAAGDIVQIDVDQIGSSTAGQGYVVTIYGYRLGV